MSPRHVTVVAFTLACTRIRTCLNQLLAEDHSRIGYQYALVIEVPASRYRSLLVPTRSAASLRTHTLARGY